MINRSKLLLIASIAVLASACSQSADKAKVVVAPQPAPKAADGQVVVSFKPSELKRPGAFRMTDNWAPPADEELSRGELVVGTEKVTIYIPTYGPYTVASPDQHSFTNVSTALSVDSNNDRELDDSEKWFSSMPVRIGDQMFEVKAFDPGGTWALLAESNAPLSGLVVGKPCPDFEFTTTDGKKVSLGSFRGKSFLIDVWSMT